MRIGVLALQGAFIEHIHILQSLGVEAVEVRLPDDLIDLDGLIIPGGESTTIGKLAVIYGLIEPIKEFAANSPIWGTCAGMILMAKDVDSDQPTLDLMDIAVERNAFGRQLDSFIADLTVPRLDNGQVRPFPAVFIRAPRLESTDERAGVEVLARLHDGTAVAARQGHWLATSFHPELTGDSRFHEFFLSLVDPDFGPISTAVI
jgi:5'-phosphate synthase pdxT subunit